MVLNCKLDPTMLAHAKQVIMGLLSRVKVYEVEKDRAKKGKKIWRLICVVAIIVSALIPYLT